MQQALAQIAALDARSGPQNVAYNGCTVRWRRFGEGPPLVLLHGGHGNWLHWVRNIDALARHHTLWLPDLPGFGDSSPLPGPPHAPDRLARLLAAVIGTLDELVGPNSAIDLAGFSFGGLVAAQLAAGRKGVRRLALLGPAGHGGGRRQSIELIDWRLPEPAAMRVALAHNLGAFMLHAPVNTDGLALAVHEMACRATRFRSKSISRTAQLTSVLDASPRPVLMVWGEHDVTAVPEQAAQLLAQDRAEREWCVVPGAGHWVQYERAHEVNALLTHWFA